MKQPKQYAVIGYPLDHTMSPPLHRMLFELSGVDAEYRQISIKPEDFAKTMPELLKLDGFNVTMPYKLDVIPYLTHMSEEAMLFQAVNTVGRKPNGDIMGWNTDIEGVKKSLELLGVSPRISVCIAGAGATARMISTFFVKHGGRVTIAVRGKSLDKAQRLKEHLNTLTLNPDITLIDIDKLNSKPPERYDLLVNATPCGMYPNIDACPFSVKAIKSAGAVYDLIYNPNETTLIKEAQRLNKPCVNGMPMLVWQAVYAHDYWYNAKFDEKDITGIIKKMRVNL